MSESLDVSFKRHFADEEWLQAGVAGLSQQMVGEQDIEELVSSIINYATEYTGSKVGALYLYDENNGELALKTTYALTGNAGKRIKAGEGIVWTGRTTEKNTYNRWII